MLNLSAAAIIEKNKMVSDSVWIVLLEVETPDGSICLASNNKDIEWGGRTWTAFPFIIDQLKQEKDELIEVPVRISNVSRFIEYYVEYYDGLIGKQVVLRVVNSEFLNEESPEVEENFVIVSASTDATWCTFKLGSGFPLRQRFPRNRILKDFCPFAYGGKECGAQKVGTCGKTLSECFKHQNTIRFGGEAAMCIGGIYSDIEGSVTYDVMYANSTTPVIHTGDEPVIDDNSDDMDNGDDF